MVVRTADFLGPLLHSTLFTTVVAIIGGPNELIYFKSGFNVDRVIKLPKNSSRNDV